MLEWKTYSAHEASVSSHFLYFIIKLRIKWGQKTVSQKKEKEKKSPGEVEKNNRTKLIW